MLLLAGNVRPSTPAPCGRRDLLTTGPGPDAGGSKPGKEGCDHMPEKSGMAARPAAGPAVCPKAGVAAATASITSKPKFPCLCITVSISRLVRATTVQRRPPTDGTDPPPANLFFLALPSCTTCT